MNFDFKKLGESQVTDKTRNCANCACSFIQENSQNKLEKQMFCRRNTPMAAEVAVDKPRLINGQVDIDKRTGKPMMVRVKDIAYLYAPTREDMVCFDGWRPMGTEPGVGFVSDNSYPA
jgi:hypothetical protein